MSSDRKSKAPALQESASKRCKQSGEVANAGVATVLDPNASNAVLVAPDHEASVDPGDRIAKLIMTDFRSDNESIVLQAVKEVYSFVNPSNSQTDAEEKQNADVITSLGGYSLIRILMEDWIDSQEIQENAIHALVDVSFHDSLMPSRPFIRIGLFEQICVAWQRYQDDEVFIDKIFHALFNMVLDSKDNAQHLVEKVDGIKKTVASMKRHQSCEDVQLMCAELLEEITFYQKYRALVIKSGGIQVLGDAIQRFPDNDELQDFAKDVLACLATRPNTT
ncbi:hypothetical protein MPSEU_001079600 [Mayamaea pseudoterrestris]|nr:hypothetical protein MPSEU_001079600 [Mayamaea pseudoterrestris]